MPIPLYYPEAFTDSDQDSRTSARAQLRLSSSAVARDRHRGIRLF